MNQHPLVHIETCDMFWPFEKANAKKSDLEVKYFSQIRVLLGARACVTCDFGPSDQKFAQDLFARGIPIKQIEMAISLGCSRKYASLLNGTDNELIFRFAYFRDLIVEASEADPDYWKSIGNPLLTKMETKWRAVKKSTLPNSAPARRKGEKETR